MTTTTPPEVQAAAARLAALPALVPARLASAILEAAQAAAVRRQHAADVAEASHAATVAVQGHDVGAAALAASRLAGLELFVPSLPSTDLDPGAVDEALALAAEQIQAAAGAIPVLPLVSYTVEVAAYGSLPQPVLAGIFREHGVGHPVPLSSDLGLQSAVDALKAELASIQGSCAAWNRSGGDVLERLETVASILAQFHDLADRFSALSVTIHNANLAREAAGFRWRVPAGHYDVYKSPEIRALAALEV